MTRTRRISLVAAIVGTALAVTQSAFAVGSVNQVIIATLQVATLAGNPFAIINFTGGVGGTPPSCALFPRLGMAVDVNTSFGKAVMSTATAAFLAGKKVTVSGTGTCANGVTSNGTELVAVITVVP